MGSTCLAARYRVKCDGFGCNNYFFADRNYYKDPNYKFCKECKSLHSYQVLVLQSQHQSDIRDLIVEASTIFQSAKGMADYLDISPPTLYSWLRLYFDMDFQSWRRHYICRAQKCMVLDICSMPVNYKYGISERIMNNRSCACFVNMGGRELLITSAKPQKIREIFRNAPEVVSDGTGINRIRYPIKFENLSGDEVRYV